jgi:KDO2-lipid IV(A) lauroyltransferase
MPQSAIDARFRITEGLEHLEAAKAKGKGVIVALPHVGSWEWGGSFLASLGHPMTAVAEALEPPALFRWFAKKRAAIGITIVPLGQASGPTLLRTLKEGGVVGLVSDRDIQGNGIKVDFFGESIAIPPGPATLALRTEATLLVAACYSGPRDGHHAVISPPLEIERSESFRTDVKALTQVLAHELEDAIRRAPQQWHDLQPRFETP